LTFNEAYRHLFGIYFDHKPSLIKSKLAYFYFTIFIFLKLIHSIHSTMSDQHVKLCKSFKEQRLQGLSWVCRPGACGKTGLCPRWCRLPHPGEKTTSPQRLAFQYASVSSLELLECPHHSVWSRCRQHIQLENRWYTSGQIWNCFLILVLKLSLEMFGKWSKFILLNVFVSLFF